MAETTDTTNLSRRAMLGSLPAAALAVSAIVPPEALAAGPDPVFAAIIRHKKAYAHVDKVTPLTDKILALQEGRAVTDKDEDIVEQALAEESVALAQLLATAPLTLGGMFAFISHVNSALLADADLADAFETLQRSAVISAVAI